MRFEITGKRIETKRMECSAESPHEAVAMFEREHPGFAAGWVDEVVEATEGAVNGWQVVDHCEACGVVILDDDSYDVDEDGVRYCPKCAKSI